MGIGDNVRIISVNHDMKRANLQGAFSNKYNHGLLAQSKGPISIGNNVWIGDSVIILLGIKIGDGAVIGAGAIVIKDIAPFSIANGIPANIKKKRFSQSIINQLLEIKWWDWDENKIRMNKEFFTLDLTESPNIELKKIIKLGLLQKLSLGKHYYSLSR